ncbi:MAG: ceramidase domain-containing protein [Alphaproteobacteria bacterium]|nr:ceramidase domain-containing protein [Alphaproteobacteria bacterium]MDE2630196.1 ceramidase domain-containing protein [Alphaproteobacteria bacterium]
MVPHGPIYCETGHPWLFMAEPVNTLTNAFIILAAILAVMHVRRSRVGFSADLVVLLFLLFAVGIGSFLWHGLRTLWALQLDWIPGMLFLIVFCGLWMRRLFGRIAGIAGPVAMLAAAVGSVALAFKLTGADAPRALTFAPAFATIAAVGAGLVFATDRKFGPRQASLGAVILMFGVAAAVFRSIDLMMCGLVPFGTHFLWHICLSTASYLGIVLLVRLKTPARAT